MKLRIVHQLSLLLLGAVVLSMATVGGVVFWNLRGGFGEYLRARDDAELSRFVQLIELRAAADPSLDWLRGSRAAMQEMGEAFTAQENADRPPPRRERRPPPRDGKPGDDPNAPPAAGPPDAARAARRHSGPGADL